MCHEETNVFTPFQHLAVMSLGLHGWFEQLDINASLMLLG